MIVTSALYQQTLARELEGETAVARIERLGEQGQGPSVIAAPPKDVGPDKRRIETMNAGGCFDFLRVPLEPVEKLEALIEATDPVGGARGIQQ